MFNNTVLERIWRELAPFLETHGFELIEVELAGSTAAPTLRIFVDKPSGSVTLDDCTRVTRLLDPLLDLGEFIRDRYMLEVSSPGIDRPLRKLADFDRFKGEEVRLETHAATQGRKRFTGVILGTDDGLISLECEGRRYEIHHENLKKANLNR